MSESFDLPREHPLVSVIVRSMARPTLTAALDSIGAQDYANVEAVVVSASGATHPAVPDQVGRHPVRFVPSAIPLSRPLAANAGIDHAAGTWITFLDDDDTIATDHVSGLVDMLRSAPDAEAAYSLARASFRDGSTETWGQPYALIQLYERNFIHLSTALFARALVLQGCRFDPQFEIMEDWDFFLQIAQHTRFHFEPRMTFQWNADAGESGAGGGRNQNDTRFATHRNRIYAKWAGPRDALVERVGPLLQQVASLAQQGDHAGAEAICRDVLAASPNDPWALNMLAMIRRAVGDLRGARSAQELAVAIRPHDPGFVYNLAVLCRAQGEVEFARRCCERSLALAPGFAPAQRLHAELGAAAA
jgi:tetratricopeptide (TPR) repeat protein